MSSDETSEQRLWAPDLPSTFERIGRYAVVKTLGAGGMASIYLARATGKGGFEKWVAIKRPHPHLANRPNVVTMILNEARLVARLEHENVCPIIDVDSDEQGPYIVMPYLHGESLAEVIRTFSKHEHTLPIEHVAHIGACVADGLHYAHNARSDEGTALNVIHRDISPQNIFLTFQGSVKVLDFGVAKAIGFESSTAVGSHKGKYAYMSPEQVRSEPVDRRSDIFSLGVVLWEALACRRLFRRESDGMTVDAVATHRAPMVTDVAPHVPEHLASLIDRALEPDRRSRYQTALELSQALRAFLGQRRSFIGTTDMQTFMASTFPSRAEMRDPLSNPTEIDQPLRRTATDVAVQVLVAFDEVSKPDATERMEPVSKSFERAPTHPPVDGANTMPDQPLDMLYSANDSQETTIPPLPRGRSEETLRPPGMTTADEHEELEDPDGIEGIEALEERTLDPANAATEDAPALDPEIAATLQLHSMAREQISSKSEPLVVPLWTEPGASLVPPLSSAANSTTAKVPAAHKEASDRKLAQGVLGLALILLAISIVLWARQCSPQAHAEPVRGEPPGHTACSS